MNAELFEAQRPRLVGVAYGMLGSVMDAEDIVQEAYLRWSEVEAAAIDSPAAYLTTVTTRLAIDRLRSAQRRREAYVGPWLPEPMVTDDNDPADVVATAERLSMALLVAMERLNPIERAVLLLRDVFDLDYAAIADVVDRSPENCRQIASRARERVGDPSRSRSLESEERRLAAEYATAISNGDVAGLARILADDVVLWSDGGGRARAARHPLAGRDRVAKYLVAVSQQAPPDAAIRLVTVNGSPGWLATAGGAAVAVIGFEIADDLITGIRIVLNPDKLGHLPTTAG
jgi:RNA polymerase sigma-70 factor (ECF subfamily)